MNKNRCLQKNINLNNLIKHILLKMYITNVCQGKVQLIVHIYLAAIYLFIY